MSGFASGGRGIQHVQLQLGDLHPGCTEISACASIRGSAGRRLRHGRRRKVRSTHMKEAPLIRRILSLCCKPLTAQGGYTTAAHGRDSALGPCWVEQAAQAADRHASLLAAPALGTTASGTEDREQRDALGPLRGAVRGLPGFRHPGVGGLTPGGVSCRSQALLMILPEGVQVEASRQALKGPCTKVFKSCRQQNFGHRFLFRPTE